jgi:hypothetical protein
VPNAAEHDRGGHSRAEALLWIVDVDHRRVAHDGGDRTNELKSTPSDATIPDTCEPTSTVLVACSVPVAKMRRMIVPEVTSPVVTSTTIFDRKMMYVAGIMTAAMTLAMM